MSFINNLKGYQVSIHPKAEKDLAKIDQIQAKKIGKKLKDLVTGEPNVNVIMLRGNYQPPRYRLKCGDYRAIFIIEEDKIIILVIAIGHRKDIYERS